MIRVASKEIRILLLYGIPALLYAMYNNLLFINLQAFDPGTYNVLIQLKIAMTEYYTKSFFPSSWTATNGQPYCWSRWVACAKNPAKSPPLVVSRQILAHGSCSLCKCYAPCWQVSTMRYFWKAPTQRNAASPPICRMPSCTCNRSW